MAGIIEELQRGALDPHLPEDALLRRVQLAAVKLKLANVEDWVKSELNGYPSNAELPTYRVFQGQLRAWNPYQGWLPVLFQDTEMAETVSTARISQSVGTLVDLVREKNKDESGLHYPLSAGYVNILDEILNYDSPRYIIQLSRGHIIGILDKVRNLILDWAIRMEQQGILGEGITFSDQERKKAQNSMTNITIGSIENFAGNLGEGNRSTTITATQSSNDGDIFARLANALDKAIPDGEERDKMRGLVATMAERRDTPGPFAASYGEFIAAAANHMQIISPFLPALLPFLGG